MKRPESLLLLCALSIGCRANDPYREVVKPRLLVSAERQVGDVRVQLAVVDNAGVKHDSDAEGELDSVAVSLVLRRGPEGARNALGRIEPRVTYQGPLGLRLRRPDGSELRHDFAGPNAPRSTPNRTVYEVDVAHGQGRIERIVVEPVAGWTQQPLGFSVAANAGKPQSSWLIAMSGLLAFSGLIALGAAGRSRT